MVRSKKASSKKQAGGSIDFKKIKRKIGRKLPPSKNATNTQIKSKAIVLPEQSVMSERSGLAVSSKGLTLKELLQQTSHHNAKIRKSALTGIRDLLLKYPSEVKLHKLAIIDKLRERVCDSEKSVRDVLYHLLKTVVFATSQEDPNSHVFSSMMSYIFSAMTHLSLDIRLMAFKFLDLIITSYPSLISLYAEKVLDNYREILQNHQVYLTEKAKVKNAIAGLAHCLSLLGSDRKEIDTKNTKEPITHRGLHLFEFEGASDQRSTLSVSKKLEELLLTLMNCFKEFAPEVVGMSSVNAVSFDCMLSALQCIKTIVSLLAKEVDQPHTSFMSKEIKLDMLGKLFASFPFSPTTHAIEKEHGKFFILNTKVAEIFFHINKEIYDADTLAEKFLQFLENSFYEQINCSSQSVKVFQEKHLISLIPFIPKLISQVRDDWRWRLLKAFTCIFEDCKIDTKLYLSCLVAIEDMLSNDVLSIEYVNSDILAYQVAWLHKLPISLLQLQETNPSLSKVILKLMLKFGQGSSPDSPLGLEYDNLQFLMLEFYCIPNEEGEPSFGPFLRLPTDCQELSLCCLYYFSCLTVELLEALANCCLRSKPVSLRVVDALRSAYKAGHIKIAEFISFLVTIVTKSDPQDGIYCFSLIPKKMLGMGGEGCWSSNNMSLKFGIGYVTSCLSEMGDNQLVMQLLIGVINKMLSGSVNLPTEEKCKLQKALDMLMVVAQRELIGS